MPPPSSMLPPHDPRQVDTVVSSSPPAPGCTPFVLPSGGLITLEDWSTINLTGDAVFQPSCAPAPPVPFFASSTPVIYVVATTTVIAWLLLVVLLITPRAFAVFAPGGVSRLLPGRGLLSALSGRSSLFATGSRPWLQTAAALSVAVSMTVATVDTFNVARHEYKLGVQDANVLRQRVTDSFEMRVLRIVSDLFLWLAQVQTLIRLFPRHKEKLLIKWIGFCLIFADIIFSCLRSFSNRNLLDHEVRFNDAISALSYLFQLSLSLLYATWVCYYAITKRRYAFYHDGMPNICIIALLSCISISIPVAFFIADINNAGVASWGDYIRWVGAAAASIVVWEWVERIEAIEREDKKDGILGREVFDGDEMLNTTPSDSRTGRHHRRSLQSQSDSTDAAAATAKPWVLRNLRNLVSLSPRMPPRGAGPTVIKMNGRVRVTPLNASSSNGDAESASLGDAVVVARRPNARRRRTGSTGAGVDLEAAETPSPSHSPVDRSNAASAESTVYAVRYHPVTDTPPVPTRRSINTTTATTPAQALAGSPQIARGAERLSRLSESAATAMSNPHQHHQQQTRRSLNESLASSRRRQSISHRRPPPFGRMGHFAINTFRRSRRSPPLEVKNAMSLDQVVTVSAGGDSPQTLSIPMADAPLGTVAAATNRPARLGFMGRRLGNVRGDSSSRGTSVQGRDDMQPKVIPAPPRGQTWSPDDARHSPMDTILSSGTPAPATADGADITDATPVPPVPGAADTAPRSNSASDPEPDARAGRSQTPNDRGLDQQQQQYRPGGDIANSVQHFPQSRLSVSSTGRRYSPVSTRWTANTPSRPGHDDEAG